MTPSPLASSPPDFLGLLAALVGLLVSYAGRVESPAALALLASLRALVNLAGLPVEALAAAPPAAPQPAPVASVGEEADDDADAPDTPANGDEEADDDPTLGGAELVGELASQLQEGLESFARVSDAVNAADLALYLIADKPADNGTRHRLDDMETALRDARHELASLGSFLAVAAGLLTGEDPYAPPLTAAVSLGRLLEARLDRDYPEQATIFRRGELRQAHPLFSHGRSPGAAGGSARRPASGPKR